MDGTIQAYVLDMAADTKKEPLRVKQYDTNSRQARIMLKMGGEPWTIPFGCQIHINVRKTDGKLADATCTREDEHTVLAPVTEQMTAVTGTQSGELYFLAPDGDIKSQTFPIAVYPMVMDQARIESSDDFQSLQEALRDVKASTDTADIAAQYATEQGNSARDGAQRANDAADSIQVAVDAAAAAKECESNAKDSETAAAQTQQEVTGYVEAQKAAFVGYSQRESDSKYANALTETATGEGSITVEDAWTAPVLGLEVAGKSEQVVTTGKNLFGGKALAEKLLIEVEATVDKANKTVEYNSSKMEGKVLCIDFEEGKEYTIILYGRNKSSQYKSCNIKIVYVDGVAVTMDFETVGSYSYCVFHTNSQRNVKNLSGSWSADSTILYYEKCGIFEGNIALEDFEPYTGGAPSPSPDYPQDIISTGTVSTGAQLWNPISGMNARYCTYTVDDNQEITLVSTGGASYIGEVVDEGSASYDETTRGFFTRISDNEKYCLISANATFTKNYVTFFDVDKKSLGYVMVSNGEIITPPIGSMYAAIRIGIAQSVAGSVYKTKVMFRNIKSKAEWEPYTGGKPAPSVEYPQTLEVTATGTNLLDLRNGKSGTGDGVTYTNNGDGTYKRSGMATGDAGNVWFLGGYGIVPADNSGNVIMTLAVGKTYTVTDCSVFTVERGTILTIKGTVTIDASIYPNGFRVTGVRNSSQKVGTVIDDTVYPMLNVGDTPAPYEPYRSSIASITLTEPLCDRDRIMCRDGVWGIERQIGKKVLTGNENAHIYTNETLIVDTVSLTIAGAAIGDGKPAKCTHSDFMILRYRGDRGEGLTSFVTVTSTVLWTKAGITPETFKAFLKEQYEAGTPVTILYLLATPTWEPFPDATQQALNELTTYAGTTHLTITAGGPAAEVTLDYVQDTHKALEQCQEAAKEYTDNQIAAIVAALPTATQAAIVDNQTTRLLQEV